MTWRDYKPDRPLEFSALDLREQTDALRDALERLLAQDRFERPYVDAARVELVALAARLSEVEAALREIVDYGDRAAVQIAKAALAAAQTEGKP